MNVPLLQDFPHYVQLPLLMLALHGMIACGAFGLGLLRWRNLASQLDFSGIGQWNCQFGFCGGL